MVAQHKQGLHKPGGISATIAVSTRLPNTYQDILCLNWPDQSSSDTSPLSFDVSESLMMDKEQQQLYCWNSCSKQLTVDESLWA